MSLIEQINYKYLYDLLNQKIEALKKELAEAKEQLLTIQTKLEQDNTGMPIIHKKGGRQKTERSKRAEALILATLDNKSLETKEITETIQKQAPDLDDNTVRRILSKLGKRGILENFSRGQWRKKQANEAE